MSPPYRKSEFEIVYGLGIDKVAEMMELINEYEIGRKYGKYMTIDEVKYELEEFKTLLLDNPEFYDELKAKIVAKINQTDIPVEEEIEEEEIPQIPTPSLFNEHL
jgi:recombination protein RecA